VTANTFTQHIKLCLVISVPQRTYVLDVFKIYIIHIKESKNPEKKSINAWTKIISSTTVFNLIIMHVF